MQEAKFEEVSMQMFYKRQTPLLDLENQIWTPSFGIQTTISGGRVVDPVHGAAL